jgi:uncharacterized protein YdbL (DUF1318 family)
MMFSFFMISVLIGFSQYSFAGSLDAPRAAGLVGERYDGLAVIRDGSANADIKALTKSVNTKRRALYQSVADGQNTKIQAVAKIYAAKIYEKAPAGYWFLSSGGQWSQK